MNKIFFICIAFALLLAGCNSNSKKETENYSKETEYTTEMEVTSEHTTITADIYYETEIIVTESTENQSQTSDFSDDIVQEELLITNEENQESEVEIATSVMEDLKETVTTTIVENTESVSVLTAVNDGVIEFPFVPVR